MSLVAAYSPGSKQKQYVCVEINNTYALAGGYIPSGPNVQGTFNSPLLLPIVATISVSAGGTVTAAGPNFIFGGAALSYIVIITLNRKFSGNLNFILGSLNNDFVSYDKLCNFSVGNPDILSFDTEVVGNCLQAIFNSNPATSKTIGWSEVDEITTLTFTLTRQNIGSSVSMDLGFIEKSFAKWEKEDSPLSWTDPETNTNYTTLPAGVYEVTCQENNERVSYIKELCYKVTSPISFDYSANPLEPWDAYNGIRPRTDGIPFLTYSGPPSLVAEFSADGTSLYTISGSTIFVNVYNNQFVATTSYSIPISFISFPAAAAYIPVGLAVHDDTGNIYIMYMDNAISRRLHLAFVKNGILNYVGDCQYTSPAVVGTEGHDICFTKSDQLIFAHGDKIHLVDHTTGIIDVGSYVTISPINTGNAVSIRNVSKYYNGDLHLSGGESVLGNAVYIYDGETYTKIKTWSAANSVTIPDSPLSVAYPINPEIKFNRLYIKNIETNKLSIDDRDIITGLEISIPKNSVIVDCNAQTTNEVAWTDDICYTIDKNIVSQGFVEISGGQIVSNAACNPVGGFVPPVAITYSSMTHNLSGNVLYALNAGGLTLDSYNWTVISTPGGLVSTPLTGLTVGATPKSLRTRWLDGTMWLMTEQVVGSNRNFVFWIVNTSTGACTRQGVVTYPAGSNANGHFTWGVDDNLYFTATVAASTYRIYKLSKISYNTVEFIADVNYVVDNINTDIPNQRLILSKAATTGLDFFSYSGQFLATCGGATYQDAMAAPFGIFAVGDTINRVKRVFVKDLITGNVTSYYHDYLTGEDILLPPMARIVSCDNTIIPASPSIPRFQLFTGIVSFNKQLLASNAKSITVTRIAGNITITDTFSGPFNINAAFTTTWTADQLGGQLIVAGTAAGSIFSITWL